MHNQTTPKRDAKITIIALRFQLNENIAKPRALAAECDVSTFRCVNTGSVAKNVERWQ